MNASWRRGRAIALIIAALVCAPGLAVGKTVSSSPVLPGGNSKEPISIAADKLNYFDKEQKAVYTGNVVAIQGDSKLTCSVLTIFLAKTEAPAADASASAAAAPAASAGPEVGTGGSQVKHMDATGPVTLVSKTQVATGDRGSYDKEQNKVWLFDNVTLSDGGNVTKGDKLTYDLTTGEAVVEVGKTSGRVIGQFIQGSSGPDTTDKSATPKKDAGSNATDKPKAAKKKVPADNTAPKTQ
ncbi:LptA/OstA family protein [Methylocapsa sp. S129]|uniref:LptA/OstA family protein n=1 Tax=Methylocapsa sp. S129 TaxID=1641869 RepID=UPI00131B9533|nr:LptA/OstA family protein [Methylocapsa sp. S129]